MKYPRHLWTGDWRSESEAVRSARSRERERARATAGPEGDGPEDATPAAEEMPGPPSRRSRTNTIRLGAVLILAAIAVGVAFAAGAIFGDGGNGSRIAGDDVKPLPAISGKPIKPTQGRTRAGTIYAMDSPAVVSLRTSEGSGTGFLIDTTGTLVTNPHLVGQAKGITVRFGQHGRNLSGQVLGSDPSSDLAVVKIDQGDVPGGVKPLKLADSRDVRVGDAVIAIGNPFGLDRTETQGIVSAVHRSIQAPNNFQIDDAIQTDAAINPGNSGGPLLDDTGRVIGVNSQIETSGSQGNVGVGFAVPSNSVRQVVPRLKRGQKIARPWLGVETRSSVLGGSGAEVASVIAGGPAEKAGVQQGDVLVRVDGRSIVDSSDVARAVNSRQPGDRVAIEVNRAGRRVTIHVELGLRPTKVP
jgi:putative serine protease PepD